MKKLDSMSFGVGNNDCWWLLVAGPDISAIFYTDLILVNQISMY